MGLSCFGGNDDVGAVPGRLQGDGLADASAGAGDVKGLARQFTTKRTPSLVIRYTLI